MARILRGSSLKSYLSKWTSIALFILCTNILSCLLEKEFSKWIQGIQFTRKGPRVLHLMFADDTILFFLANLDYCARINNVISSFCEKAGLSINRDKSSLIFSPNMPKKFNKKMIAHIFHIKHRDKLGKYLWANIDQERYSCKNY